MKYLKWFFILLLVFISAILAGPMFVICSWLDKYNSDYFLDYIGEQLKKRMIEDFTL